MCGVFGFFTPVQRIERVQALIPRALAALAHRGPDDQGATTSAGDAFAVAFAHTRLAILDPSRAGHQPMASPCGRYLLLFNGEIYNHRELRRELETEGVRFRGDSDTETLLQLLIREDRAALSRINGMFAIAFWDRERQVLWLARDRVGEKPLYFLRRGDELVFASELRALMSTGLCERRVRVDALRRWLTRGSCRGSDTLLPHVQQVRPGHVVSLGPEGLRDDSYWALPPDAPILDWRDRLPPLLEDAVRLRLLADRPLGVFLSGGVDSAVIAALASRHTREALTAFTLCFDEEAWNEGDRAASVARSLRIRHEVARLTGQEVFSAVDDALAAQDLPSHDGFNTWFIARFARSRGLVVALSGTGGDELFAGYAHFALAERLAMVGRLGRLLPASLRSALAGRLPSRLPTRVRKGLALLATGGEPEELYGLIREVFSPAQVEDLVAPTIRRSGAEPELRLAGASPGRGGTRSGCELTRLELAEYLVDTQLRDIDVMSMAHALEVRSPLLDHRLVELLVNVPSHEKNPAGPVNKLPLLQAAGLSPEAFRGAKRGFLLPWEAWLRGPLAPWVRRHLEPTAILETGILDPRGVKRVIDAFSRGRLNYSRVLALVALQAFLRRHGVTGGA
jgi:asparagine synthase (glutamine-hydrolysing)